jgi:peroxiredoxin
MSGCEQVSTVATEANEAAAGLLAPDFLLRSSLGGQEHLAELRGHAVLVCFLSTRAVMSLAGADPSRSQIVFLKSMNDQYSSRGLRILMVDASAVEGGSVSPLASLINFAYDWDLRDIQLLRDDTGKTAKTYGVKRLPTTFSIDQNGRINRRWNGIATVPSLEHVVKSLLAEKANGSDR